MSTEHPYRYQVVDEPEALKELARRLNYNGVCYPAREGQLLHEWWKVSTGHYEKVVIVAAFDGELPIGGILHHKYDTHVTMFFVNPEYRRQGIAARMVELLRTHPYAQRVIEAMPGHDHREWMHFFHKARILCRSDDNGVPHWVPDNKAHNYVQARQRLDRKLFRLFRGG